MSGRLPLADDAAAIAARLREIQAERATAIAGPSQIEMALEALNRARARVTRGDDIIERACAEKLARHRVLS